jgi:hypothetical protein
MKSRMIVFLVTLFLSLTWAAYSPATVEWDVRRTLKIEPNYLDVAVSTNGRWIFVLNDRGEVLIYSQTGTLEDRITVGRSVDGIEAGPQDNILLLTSRKEATVQVVTLNFIQKFNVAGSPFKGPADAPVVIVTFDDFQ